MIDSSYLELLLNIERKADRKLNDHVLIIDSANMFIRSFTVIDKLTANGHHVGGLYGYLRSLSLMIRTIDPTRVICVFDGLESSMARKYINPKYKANRGHSRMTKWDLFEGLDDEVHSMDMQMNRLVEYLECLPVTLISIDKIEADDTIAYLAHQFDSNGKKVTIVSSDKDYYQIVNGNIEVYSPIKKERYDFTKVVKETEVLPSNYLIMKALLGDKSDNLDGIKGLGVKTLLKEFPELKQKEGVTLDSIYSICESKLKDKKIFAQILYDWDKVEMNYQLMNLQIPRVGDNEINHILDRLRIPIPRLQSKVFKQMLDYDKIEGLSTNIDMWLDTFDVLSKIQK